MSLPTRAEVEDLFYREAALLDDWRLDEWMALLTDDAAYYVPPNDKPDADHRDTLFTIADNNARLKERVRRIKDRNCHAEHPHSRTRRMIANVRVTSAAGGAGKDCEARANFVIHRFRRGEDVRVFVGEYRYRLRREGDALKIAERRAILDAEELGSLGAVSFIL
ncbi:MAG TPA: aromatic-ring-hydroxylating dioxygenase subunit beta [Stellaceae bacterium]|nr:aromatic-ring-hydroxylating dioxygenase subunit beta [Stellaceae bacterium]